MRRKEINGKRLLRDVSVEGMSGEIEMKIGKLSAFSLKPFR